MARFTNQAQLRYGRSIANSNIAVGEILEVLSAAKEAVRNTYRQNDTITYVISIVNASRKRKKKEGHMGVGLENVRRTVEAYQGTMQCEIVGEE